MKTTIDLPDALLRRAKVTAARRQTSLKNLVVEGLQRVLSSSTGGEGSSVEVADKKFFEVDSYGVPVIKPRGATVTDALINEIREKEGI